MRPSILLRRISPIAVLLFAVPLSSCLGDESGGREADALRLRFPAQAAQILEQGDEFAASDDGFARAGAAGGLDAVLPREGAGAVRFRAAGGLVVEVRELGATGQGMLAER